MISPSDKLKPASGLQEAFGKLVPLQAEASSLHCAYVESGLVDVERARVLSQQLCQINSEFGPAWEEQRTEILLADGRVRKIFTPDYVAVVSFLKENGIGGNVSVEELVENNKCVIGQGGRVMEISVEPLAKSLSKYRTKWLQQLSKLGTLKLKGAICDPKDLVELGELRTLALCTQDSAENEVLRSLKLDCLMWYQSPSAKKRPKNKTNLIDLAPFAKIRTLKELHIDAIENKNGSSAGEQKSELSELTPLADLTELRHLAIQHSTIKKAILDKPLEQIAELIFICCRLEDLSFVQKMPNLGTLMLIDCNISCETMNYPKSLCALHITRSTVNNLAAILRPFLGRPSLSVLVVLDDVNGGKRSAEERDIVRALEKEKKCI